MTAHNKLLFVINTFSALHAGYLQDAGARGRGMGSTSAPALHVTCSLAKGSGDFYRLGRQKLIGLKILISAVDLI